VISYTTRLAEYYCPCLKWESFPTPRAPGKITGAVTNRHWPDLENCDQCGGTGILPTPSPELNLDVKVELQQERSKELGKIRDELRSGK